MLEEDIVSNAHETYKTPRIEILFCVYIDTHTLSHTHSLLLEIFDVSSLMKKGRDENEKSGDDDDGGWDCGDDDVFEHVGGSVYDVYKSIL